jgi:hypothetical protein
MIPRITLSLPRSPFLGRNRLLHVAVESGVDGIGLEMRDRFGRFVRSPYPYFESDGTPVYSLSVDAADLDLLRSASDRTIAWEPRANPLQSLIVKLPPADDSRADHAAAIAAAMVVRSLGPSTAIVLSVPAVVSDDPRAHLARMRMLKRLTTEWDFTIGIDLDRRADARWEAEAAVHLAGEKLAYVRVNTMVLHRGERSVDIAMRVLRACADSDFDGSIAVAPDVPFRQAWRPNALAESFAHHCEIVRRMFLGRSVPLPISHDPSVHLR